MTALPIAELVIPYPPMADPDPDGHISGLLHSLPSDLAEANLALIKFLTSQRQKMRAVIDQQQAFAAQVKPDLIRKLGIDESQIPFNETLRANVELLIMREYWSTTSLPQALLHREVFLYAKAFALSTDQIGKKLQALEKIRVGGGFTFSAYQSFRASFPELKELRDSVAHADERAIGMSRGRPIKPKPIVNEFIHAPGGGVSIVGSLFNDRFTFTGPSGDTESVVISAQSLFAARDAIQEALNSFPWNGRGSQNWPGW